MLKELQACNDVHDLAALLQIEAKMLTFLLYTLKPTAKYHQFCISKKNGATRQISAPDERLKSLQRRLLDLLQECDLQIQDHYPRRSSMGCEKGKTLYDNARLHSNRRWVFNFDLEDFFGSFNFGRVISYFKNNRNLGLNPKIATYIAQICVHDNQLPQGAPTSPLVANLICGSLDYRLARMAKHFRCSYSRYVDDITLSTNMRDFPEELAFLSGETWLPSDGLVDRVADSGFKINPTKTRMNFRHSRQLVTGLVVNDEPNLPREYRRQCRAAVHTAMQGKDFHAVAFCDKFSDNCESPPRKIEFKNNLMIIESRLALACSLEEKRKGFNKKRLMAQPTGIFRAYSDAILLRKLCLEQKPLLITEGPSDTLYLKSGILTLSKFFPDLSRDLAEERTLSVSFQRSGTRSAEIIGLGSGNGNLSTFISRAANFYRRLDKKVPRRRVAILVDNDDGLDHVKKIIKNIYGVNLAQDNEKDFFKLEDNFYLVKTPSLPNKKRTAIEDFLPDETFRDKQSGKVFSPDSKYDTEKHFGKVELGRKIYNRRESFDLSTLNPVLSRIDAAMKD